MSSTPSFDFQLESTGLPPLRRGPITTVQLNIGLRCNLACHHCHVESGPKRVEALDRRGAERVLELLERNPGVELLDLTGGAPELNDHFRFLVRGARALGRRVIDRCNLTVFAEPGQQDTPEFLAAQQVEIVASLPCYTRENVDGQRGRGVFDGSVQALRRLNELGYGCSGSGLRLDLVYNPTGDFLPGPQAELEFDRLLTITNMPIKRFAHQLEREGRLEEYMSLLVDNFNPETIDALMCRNLLSIGWDGRLSDCDFNYALGIGVPGEVRTIWDSDDLTQFVGQPIATGSHCFGCAAGAGSSCGGALR